jgi:hypothetical protein
LPASLQGGTLEGMASPFVTPQAPEGIYLAVEGGGPLYVTPGPAIGGKPSVVTGAPFVGRLVAFGRAPVGVSTVDLGGPGPYQLEGVEAFTALAVGDGGSLPLTPT